jgi:uncharacterized low-complexity protein
MSKIVKPLTVAMGAALLGTVAMSAYATSANPFNADELGSGYMQVGDEKGKEGSCGEKGKEGSCGEKGKEGSCGEKGKEGSCGEKGKEGSCGEKGKEGSCGEKGKEGKCGEGKCGG